MTQLRLEVVTSLLEKAIHRSVWSGQSKGTFKVPRKYASLPFGVKKICKQAGLCPCRWLGDKIPVLWHRQEYMYLFEGGAVRPLTAEEATWVGSCPVWPISVARCVPLHGSV